LRLDVGRGQQMTPLRLGSNACKYVSARAYPKQVYWPGQQMPVVIPSLQ